jgi:hypothetical protein
MLYVNELSKGIVNDLRIAVIMLSSPDIPNYAHFAGINNYLYSTKHAYDFIVERQPRDTLNNWTWDKKKQSSISWYKAELLKRHLVNYDYILFIDSDAIFNDFNYKIEDELIPLVKEKCIIFQEDVWTSSNLNTVSELICTGLIFIKNCKESFFILDEWARAPYIDKNCISMRYKHPREQECIMYLMEKNDDIKKNVYIYPAMKGMFGQYDAKWIIHMGGTNDINRTELISRYCNDKFQSFIIETSNKLYGNLRLK